MQRRIGRKNLGRKILTEVPAQFIAFDLLETVGHDIRPRPLAERRKLLEELLEDWPVRMICSPVMIFDDWTACAARREVSREQQVEGFMLKRLDSAYGVGRATGIWWKWKVDPHTVDAVLIYAQRGSGRRAALFTDYTFGVWDDGVLVPFAKAYSGLTDEEIREVDRFVRQNTLERFGPVRRVEPELVFELAFENIQRSTRHKSGIAVRFPRISRWRTDKPPDQADSLETLRRMIDSPEPDGAADSAEAEP
jgi:DNA ligase-1